MAIMGAKLSFGGGKKIGSTKAPGGGGKQAYKKNQKKSGDLFFLFFGDS